jgi:hypothetical protein
MIVFPVLNSLLKILRNSNHHEFIFPFIHEYSPSSFLFPPNSPFFVYDNFMNELENVEYFLSARKKSVG